MGIGGKKEGCEIHIISTLRLSLGTYILRKTGSKLVINVLSAVGLLPSYHNLRLYEASTVMDPPKMQVEDDAFVQFVFDNTDHNVRTLDGLHTFHSLGGIASYTPAEYITFEGGSKKLTKMPNISEIAAQAKIDIVPCGTMNKEALKSIVFEDPDKLLIKKRASVQICCSPVLAGYILGKFLCVKNLPSWKGFMEVISRDSHYLINRSPWWIPFTNVSIRLHWLHYGQ